MAKMNGATEEELRYNSWQALRHGGVPRYAQQIDFDTFADELQQLGAYLQ
jgi:hypothetical protein